jgi:hypothetical protein
MEPRLVRAERCCDSSPAEDFTLDRDGSIVIS